MVEKDKADCDLADRVEALIARASKMPTKAGLGRRGSLKEAVSLAYPALEDLKRKGYNDSELVSVMAEHGFAINAGTLRNYMAWAARQTPASPGSARPNATRPKYGPKIGLHSDLRSRRVSSETKAGLGHRLDDNDL